MKFALLCLIASVMVLGAMGAGAASDCPTICPLLYAPQCGKNSNGDRVTFANDCDMRAKNCDGKNDYVLEKSGAC